MWTYNGCKTVETAVYFLNLFSKDKTIVSKSKGSNKYMISFMIGISMFFIRVKMVSNYLEK